MRCESWLPAVVRRLAASGREAGRMWHQAPAEPCLFRRKAKTPIEPAVMVTSRPISDAIMSGGLSLPLLGDIVLDLCFNDGAFTEVEFVTCAACHLS